MNSKYFNFEPQTKLIFGTNSLNSLKTELKPFGNTLLIVAQKKIEEMGYLKRVTDQLTDGHFKLYFWSSIHDNPVVSDVDDAVESLKSIKFDAIIALGGGSTIDVAKALSVTACTGGLAWDYVYSSAKRTVSQTIPVIAIPTTSGTGSHMTKYSVLTNPQQGIKSTIVTEKIFPKVTIVDPTLMVSLPQYMTAVTGFDALSHAVESYVCINANRMTDMICEKAIQTIAKALPQVINNLNDLILREDMAWADTLAGIGIAYSGSTLPHAMGQPISGRYPKIRHGETLAAIYPSIVGFSYPGNVEKFDRIVRWIAEGIKMEIENIDAELASKVFSEFLKRIGLSIRLSDFGLEEKNIHDFIDPTLKCGDVYTNPVVATEQDIIELFKLSL
jgi:alcohol dehydrogenase class IV